MLSSLQNINRHDCILMSQRIDVWPFTLNHPTPSRANHILAPDEKTRWRQFYFEKHQRRFANARLQLREILSHYLGLSAAEIAFDYNKQGKPFLKNNPHALEFNLSHSSELAILAVGQSLPLGVDVEFFSARPYLGLAKQLFSQREIQALHQVAPHLQPLAFFHMWTQKEAFIKAVGLGLSYPTQQFSVPCLPPSIETIPDPIHHTSWTLRSFTPQLLCAAALCHHPSVKTIRFVNAI